MIVGAGVEKVIQNMIQQKASAIMSYMSAGKWHASRVHLRGLVSGQLTVEISASKNPHPMNIKVGQSVGISLKYGYGKYIFDTLVVGFDTSSDKENCGMLELVMPEQIEVLQRRSYFRVPVPESIGQVDVTVWHRGDGTRTSVAQGKPYWTGYLVDISAGGMQLAFESANKPNFRNGQFISLQFTPLPDEEPLVFSAQVRHSFPTADDNYTCVGLQAVGLEADSEGRQILRRLCEIVEKYYRMNCKENSKV